MRIGQGWDRHRLIADRLLLLGGVVIPYEKGEEGHSDGDVLLHAVTDALLGSCALGDIGSHFPPGDPAWKHADSAGLLTAAYEKVLNIGYQVLQVDAIVILEQPKLQDYIHQIRSCIAGLLSLDIGSVSVKAKTAEGFPPVGTGEAVEAFAVVTVELTEEDQSLYL